MVILLVWVKSNIYIDHMSFKYFFTQKKLNIRQRLWLEIVKDYDYKIRYHSGKANIVIDAMSRKVVLSQIIAH